MFEVVDGVVSLRDRGSRNGTFVNDTHLNGNGVAEAHAALVARLKDYVARGLDPTEEIRKNRDFHNPMLLEKIVRYFDIDDIASQFPKHIFDPEAIANRRSSQKKKPQGSPRAADAAPPA